MMKTLVAMLVFGAMACGEVTSTPVAAGGAGGADGGVGEGGQTQIDNTGGTPGSGGSGGAAAGGVPVPATGGVSGAAGAPAGGAAGAAACLPFNASGFAYNDPCDPSVVEDSRNLAPWLSACRARCELNGAQYTGCVVDARVDAGEVVCSASCGVCP